MHAVEDQVHQLPYKQLLGLPTIGMPFEYFHWSNRTRLVIHFTYLLGYNIRHTRGWVTMHDRYEQGSIQEPCYVTLLDWCVAFVCGSGRWLVPRCPYKQSSLSNHVIAISAESDNRQQYLCPECTLVTARLGFHEHVGHRVIDDRLKMVRTSCLGLGRYAWQDSGVIAIARLYALECWSDKCPGERSR